MERRTAVIAGTAALVAATGTIAAYVLTRQLRAHPARIKRAITVRAHPDELLTMWQDPELLQVLVGDMVEVHGLGDALQWAIPSAGVSWTTRVVEHEPGSLLRFESSDNDPVHMTATIVVRPAPGDWGTAMQIEYALSMPPPLRKIVELMGSSFSIQLLHNMKSLAETGAIPTLAHNPAGRNGGAD